MRGWITKKKKFITSPLPPHTQYIFQACPRAPCTRRWCAPPTRACWPSSSRRSRHSGRGSRSTGRHSGRRRRRLQVPKRTSFRQNGGGREMGTMVTSLSVRVGVHPGVPAEEEEGGGGEGRQGGGGRLRREVIRETLESSQHLQLQPTVQRDLSRSQGRGSSARRSGRCRGACWRRSRASARRGGTA